MSTFFSKDHVSSCEIAGAIASAAIHDLKVNLFTISGFPQIHVADPKDGVFKITLSWSLSKTNEAVSFELTYAEAISAAKGFKSNDNEVDRAIFNRVQSAIASLEGAVRGADYRQDRP